MSMIPTFSGLPARPSFPYLIPPYTNGVPFTYRDGMTFLRRMEAFAKFIDDSLIPWIDEGFKIYIDEFNAALEDIRKYMEGQQAIIDNKVADFNDKANAAIAAINALIVKTQENAELAQLAQDAAEAARDLAQQYAATSGQMADDTIAEFVSSDASKTNAAIAPVAVEALDPYITPTVTTIKAYTANDQYGSPYDYEIVRVSAKAANVNRIVEKTYNGYEKSYNPANPFYPPQFFLDDVVLAQGAYVGTNGDAVQGTTLPSARVTGLQIKGGVLYAGWGNYNNADPRLGNEALVFMKDGSWKTYRKDTTPDPQVIVDAGADTSYGFGPIVVEAGAIRNMETEYWADWVTTVSARTAIGRAGNGDVLIGLVKGKTGSQGIRGNELGRMMLRHGATDAIMLDGGGSTQGYSNTRFFHPSSDAAGRRASSSMILIHAAAFGEVRVPSSPLILNSGWTNATANGVPEVVKDGGYVQFTGNIDNAKTSHNTWYSVCTVDEAFRPPLGKDARGILYANGGVTRGGNNGIAQWSLSGTTGVLQIRFPGDGTAVDLEGWCDVTGIRFKAGY